MDRDCGSQHGSSFVTRTTFKTLNNQRTGSDQSVQTLPQTPGRRGREVNSCVAMEYSGITLTSLGLSFSICNLGTVTVIVPLFRAEVKTKLANACKRLRNHNKHTIS